MIRLVCIDVDPAVWSAVAAVRATGVRLAVCSGRPAFGVAREYAPRLDPDGWHVFQNGASVVHLPTGRSLSQALPPDLVGALVARARATGRTLELYTDTTYAFETANERSR